MSHNGMVDIESYKKFLDSQKPTSKVFWVLEGNVFSDDTYQRFHDAFKELNIEFIDVSFLPFSSRIVKQLKAVTKPIMVYGSMELQNYAEDYGLYPGFVRVTEKETTIIKILGDKYMNHDGMTCKMSEVMNAVPYEEFFIKPNSDSKDFAGLLMTKDRYTSWYNNLINIGYLTNDIEIFVSIPKLIKTEYRAVVIGGKLVSYCVYKKDGINNCFCVENKEVENLVNSVYKPNIAYIIDVAETDNGYKVLEYNTFNSASLYACDIKKIVQAVDQLDVFIVDNSYVKV